jgi:quinohemoprotein ethanol dehydrogenase
MTRSPCKDSACRLLGVAGALLLNLAFPTHSTLAEDLTPARINAATSAVDSAMIKANTATSRDWPTIGLDYAETRFSKLNQITSDNVGGLGLVWSYSLESARGVEATPVVIDGIMYQTGPWSIVYAIDARSGKKIWTFDPGVDRAKGYKAVATSSIAASPSTRGGCSLAPMTGA